MCFSVSVFPYIIRKRIYKPIGAPDISRFRLIDMFTHPTKKDVKDSIIRSFCQPDSHLRQVICTAAFGMGIDCPNVRQVVHWSAPADMYNTSSFEVQ